MGLSPSREDFPDLGRGAAEVYASYGRAERRDAAALAQAAAEDDATTATSSAATTTATATRNASAAATTTGTTPIGTAHGVHAGAPGAGSAPSAKRRRDADAPGAMPRRGIGSVGGSSRGNAPHGAGAPPPWGFPGGSGGGNISMAGAATADEPELVPVVLSWNFGGSAVYVTGAWDGWREKVPMGRDGAAFLAVLYLPRGQTFQFKYFVDQNWQCNPSVPTETDAHGNTNNVIVVTDPDLEYDSGAPLLVAAPPSPLSSYNQSVIEADVTLADPPLLPDAMRDPTLPPNCHVLVDHLFISGEATTPSDTRQAISATVDSHSILPSDPPPITISSTFRHKDKLISASFIIANPRQTGASAPTPPRNHSGHDPGGMLPLFSV